MPIIVVVAGNLILSPEEPVNAPPTVSEHHQDLRVVVRERLIEDIGGKRDEQNDGAAIGALTKLWLIEWKISLGVASDEAIRATPDAEKAPVLAPM